MNLRKKVFFILVALTATSAWAQTPPSIGGISYNSDISAYEINTADKLKDLAVYVNGSGTYSTSESESTAHNCAGMVFKLSDDISISCTTAWNNAASTEHNFNAISNFAGTFDGQDHTISGIRIYKDGNSSADSYQGLFGNNSGTIQNVVLANSRITGYQYIGGIAGNNTGTINACKVLNDVNIHSVYLSDCQKHGGISGATSGTISNCVSSVQITEVAGVTSSSNYGGITGYGQGLSNNIAYGVNISAKNPTFYKAAIIGQSTANDYTNNYYIDCSLINISTNATATAEIGRGGNNTCSDVDGVQQVCKVTLADEYVTVTNPTTPTVFFNETNYFKKWTPVTLGHANRAQGIVFSEYRVTKDGTDPVQTMTGTLSDGLYTFYMPDNHLTAAAIYTIGWVGNGDEGSPYLIYERDQLDLLATHVNSGNAYQGKYFKLCADITYPHTSAWDEASIQENNYTPIGLIDGNGNARHFKGIFDGDNHMISGIRIFKGGVGDPDNKMGMFGYVDGGTVKNIILADTRITGYNNVGGIVGHLIGGGKVQSCHVLDDVLIRAENASASSHGGVVGTSNFNSNNVIEYCSSSAKIAGPGNSDFGGIVGAGGSYVRNNLVIGASIDATTSTNYYGAISGDHDNSNLYDKYKNNYYWNCKIGSSDINRARGSRGENIFTNDGATPCFFITCGENVRTGDGSSTFTIPAHGNVAETTYVFSVDQRSVQVSYDAPHDHGDLEAVLAVTYTETGGTRPDLTENSTFQMPYGDITIRFKHYNLLNAIEPGKWYAISSPMHDSVLNFPDEGFSFYFENIANGTNLATGTYDLFRYNERDMTWENYKARSTTDFTTLEVGRGYIYRIGGTSNATLQYRGVENSGDIYSLVSNSRPGGNIVPLDKNGGTKDANDDQLYGLNLIGNPYPHQMYYGEDISSSSSNLNMSFYYTLEPNGSWHIHSVNENRPIGTGEAILVYASATGPLEFSDNANPPAQNSGKTLMFTVSNGTNEDVAYAVLGTANEKGMPKIAHMETGLPSLSIRQQGTRYAMAAIAEESTELPLDFSAPEGTYTITASANEAIPYCHLIDHATGRDIDLLRDSAYTFKNSNTLTNRFTVKLSPDDAQTTQAARFAYQSGDQTVITGEGTIEAYDIMGRKIFSQEVNSQLSILNSQFPQTGVYILRLDGQTQKIVIK